MQYFIQMSNIKDTFLISLFVTIISIVSFSQGENLEISNRKKTEATQILLQFETEAQNAYEKKDYASAVDANLKYAKFSLDIELFELAYEKLQQNLEQTEKMGDMNAHIQSQMFLCYVLYRTLKYDQCIDQAKEGLTVAMSNTSLKRYQQGFRNMIASSLRDQKKYDEAEEYVRASILQMERDSFIDQTSYFNLALIYLDSGKSDSIAQVFNQKALNQLLQVENNVNENVAEFSTMYAASEFTGYQLMIAKLSSTPLIDQISALEKCVETIHHWNLEGHYVLDVYELLVQKYMLIGSLEKASVILDQLIETRESLSELSKKQHMVNISTLQKLHKMESNRQHLIFKKELAEKDASKQLIVSIIAVLSFVILTILLVFLVRRYKKRKTILKKELLMKELAEKEFKKTIDGQSSNLTNMSIDISRINDFLKQLIQDVKYVEELDQQQVKRSLKSIEATLNKEVANNEKNNILYKLCQEKNQTFFGNLMIQHANLTPSEKQLCGYIRLKMSSKDIASVLGIMPKSVDMKVYRLREKMGFSSTQSLKRYIYNM